MKRFSPATPQRPPDGTDAGVERSPGTTHAQPWRGGERSLRSRGSFAVARLVAFYVIVSAVWIWLSDQWVTALVHDARMAQHMQTFKGWFFVAVTGVLLGWLARRDLKHAEAADGVLRQSRDELELVERQLAEARRIEITERARSEAALREGEAKFRTLVEQSLTGVYIIQDNRFVYVNPGLSNIFGYSAEELRTMNLLDIVREDDRAQVAENLRKRVDNEVPSIHYSFRARHKDGRRLEVEVLGSRTELNGRPAIIGTALDVTARKRAEEQEYRLATEKDHLIERLQLHFNAMPIGCIVTAPDLTVLDWNRAAGSIFGFSGQEMVGRQPYGRIIPAAARESVERFIAELLHGNQTRSLVQENETKDGRRIFCEWHDTPLRDESGLVVGVIAMVQDVTERIKTEAALRELSARLLVAQDEERRRIARELHDTTAQQLAALALNLSVISNLVVNPPPKVERILADTLRLVETTAQEVRTTSYLLHPPLLEAAGLVGTVRDYAGGFARRSGLKVNLDLQEDLGRLPPDAELALFRMVQEGLGNIHRHSGSATATIRLARETDRVSLELKDTGHGVPAEILAALQSKTGAVGVGIAGMRERLHQLNGGLEIKSGPGGTTVRATLVIGKTEQTTK